jgi:hypothetical protein
MRIVVLIAALLFLVLVAVVAKVTSTDLSDAELVKRCQASQPAWNGYQEDIKEIGARPVARWHGRPISLSVKPGEVRLTMALEPPWDAFEAAIPVMLKDPEGRVMRNDANEIDGANRVYIFTRKESADEPAPPWLEIQYPHTKRRLFLDADGTWNASAE